MCTHSHTSQVPLSASVPLLTAIPFPAQPNRCSLLQDAYFGHEFQRLQLPPPLPFNQGHQPSKPHRMISPCDLNSHNTTSTGHFPSALSPLKARSLSGVKELTKQWKPQGPHRSTDLHLRTGRTAFLKVNSTVKCRGRQRPLLGLQLEETREPRPGHTN